ncbi:DUF3100 domain-containing protein [Maridesulfovibrio salexigens]|uniref:DUF3100 domain-containing protein n=1 Tax=Maridesulfovibrio salexigens (strain ATCC 14822 / DSM 2638 / NCIMB 8403 / VKM B-1763) TaxID=526222 RepID=C6BYM9_MARSD|nr:DUF3100 domain-containing protein [Maridesulfovibrio salexigens]ACS80636.1 conserved hypothetical protein [Maridesulfovibrio salexigens DSM 2638]
MNEAVKNVKLHLVVLALVVVSELIGIMTFKVGPGKLVLLPMLYAMFIGIFLGPKFCKVVKEKDMFQASTLVGLTLLLLMARYGTLVGPKFFEILKAGPALVLQEFGNIATLLLGIPIAMYLGLKREAVGAAHSIAREPNVALIGDIYGLDSAEGRGVMGVYICGTVFGTIFFGLMASFLAAFEIFHPFALAMASGVGSASMMTASVGSLSAAYPEMAEQIQAFGVASNTLSGIDGVYMSLILALPMSNKLYNYIYKLKYKTAPEAV